MALLDHPMRFASGRLIVFEPTRVVALRAWPEPGIWAGQDEASCRLPIDLRIGLSDLDHLAQGGDRERAGACGSLLATLPESVGGDARRFPEHAWRLLSLMWHQRDAVDLVRSNPALAFGIACASDLKTEVGDRWADTGELLRRKRESIAEWLEFPGNPSTVRVLGKVTHEVIHLRGLRALRDLLHRATDRHRKMLEHVPHVNADVLEILTDDALVERIAPSFLEDVSLIRSFGAHVAARLRDAIRDHGAVGMPGDFPFIRTMQQLERHLTRIRGLENHRRIYGEAARLAGRPFPAPPLPGNGNIEPLTSVDALIDEGIEQKNCAGDYGRRAISGSLYLYRVMLPDRATLSIQAVNGRWRIDQLRSKCNGPVKDRTHQIVERWLHESQR